MKKGQFKIISDRGMHLRPASLLAQAMSEFQSDVTILYQGEKYDAKSIMALTSTAMKQNAEFELQTNGTDEAAAMEKAAELINSGLGDL